MATRTISLQAPTQQDIETMISSYIAQGFVVANRTPTSVTLTKRKEFSILWAVIGFFFCLLPLLIYLIVYAAESDQMVVISLAGTQPGYGGAVSGQLPAPQAAYGYGGAPSGQLNPQRSPDGNYWWDGQTWRPVSELTNPGYPTSPGTLPPSNDPYNPNSGPYMMQ